MALDRKEVEEIALLARIALAPDELARMQVELGTILEHFGVIAAVDTTGIVPMTHAVPKDLPLRADDVEPSLSQADALAGAPKRAGELFVVPAIIAGDE
ncbi:MAG TPA: Asp-tRNA(Asn)/Glu-tRNA(Gln) amidotransferase subunit GatC [Kofleriaceae bacterium]|nr:Asp-tRNA(Asn)/Glu-tRNA(Gln) amidotransferase subunit GatC [Kofleriaceae bacterium]